MDAQLWSPSGAITTAWARLTRRKRVFAYFAPYVALRGLFFGYPELHELDVKLELWAQLAIAVGAAALLAWLQGGTLRVALELARDEDAELAFADTFRGIRTTIPMFVGNLLWVLGVSLGIALLIVPGVVFLLATTFWPFIVIDRGLDPIGAMRESHRLTSGHKKALLVMYCAVVGLSWATWSSLSLFGDFLIVPLYQVALAWIYLNRVTFENELPTLPTGEALDAPRAPAAAPAET